MTASRRDSEVTTVDTMSVATKLARVATGTHTAIYRASKGKVAGGIGGRHFSLLTTTGRRSGRWCGG